MARKRVGVLISGRGSNLVALIEATRAAEFPAEIALVVSDREDAGGLARAKAAGIATEVVSYKAFGGKAGAEAEISRRLQTARIELVCLAGFMRVLSQDFVTAWRDRLINIHPSLLPSFPGLDTHRRALEAGVKIHGCTVHFVRAEVDQGPIVVQAAVSVLASDDEESLAARILAAEHRIYPQALALVASGDARVEGEHVSYQSKEAHGSRVLIAPAP